MVENMTESNCEKDKTKKTKDMMEDMTKGDRKHDNISGKLPLPHELPVILYMLSLVHYLLIMNRFILNHVCW